MKTVAIICEYDPFHLGHKIQIDLVRAHFGADTTVISIMSGSTVQRGRLSIYPKHLRAEAAIKNGSDLVLELPFPYCSSSAEHFAKGAVALISSLGGVDILAFGSENGDVDALSCAADVIRSEEYLNAIRENGKNGHIKSAEEIFHSLSGDGFPTTPNDILAVEYIAALKDENCSILPYTYKREEGYSASRSRELIYGGADASEMLPESAISVFERTVPTDPAAYEAVALHTLRITDTDTLSSYYGMNGGVAGLIKANAESVSSLDELISSSVNKSYTAARIRRAILSSVLGVKAETVKERPLFTALLAANGKGREYLNKIRKTASVNIVTKTADGFDLPENVLRQFELSLRADKLMALCRKEATSEVFKRNPYIE
ncbi:MAG: nucleotidyltransferase family protein [Clostridia bacterium]|nr:nucleotidyltransferase family protein [Clostridia bacterium]